MVILGTNTSTTSPMIRHTTNGSLEAIRGEEQKDRGANDGKRLQRQYRWREMTREKRGSYRQIKVRGDAWVSNVSNSPK